MEIDGIIIGIGEVGENLLHLDLALVGKDLLVLRCVVVFVGDALAEHISLGNALVSQIHLGLDPVGTQQLIPAVLGYNVVLQDGAVKRDQLVCVLLFAVEVKAPVCIRSVRNRA